MKKKRDRGRSRYLLEKRLRRLYCRTGNFTAFPCFFFVGISIKLFQLFQKDKHGDMNRTMLVRDEAASAKDTAELDALQDISTHSFTDVCDASTAFHFSTTCASQAPLEALRHLDQTAELYLDASVAEKRMKSILQLPTWPDVPAASSAAGTFPSQDEGQKDLRKHKAPHRLSRLGRQNSALLAKKEEEWAAKIRAVVTEICLVCVLLLGMTWNLRT